MNMVPLILVLILAVCSSSSSSSMGAPKAKSPCSEYSNEQKYDNFQHKHVIQSNFDRNSDEAWIKYLKSKGLCGRKGATEQSFMEKSPDYICTSDGRQYGEGGDLCMSKDKLVVYNIKSTKDCKTMTKNKTTARVVVGCQKVEDKNNKCLPVHFDTYTNDNPGNIPCV